MNILALTKFPPIQGGESTNAFFLFDALGTRGHNITVLTNYDDVPQNNKAAFVTTDFDILRANKNVNIVSVKAESVPEFIPQYDPKTEKLLNEGVKILSAKQFDLIYGWYFLPYVSAAYLLSSIFSIPFVIQHAGSDLTRIWPAETLNSYFNTIIEAASGILTYPSTASYFQNKNPEHVLKQKPSFPDIYNPEGKQVNFLDAFNIECNPSLTFLCLGKFSLGKGFYELIETFRLIDNATLILLCPNKKSVSVDLPKNVFLLDAVSPWRIPAIIRSVRALIVPEWNFGVASHRSLLPIESILCGKSALVSNQVIGHYAWFRQFMIGIETPNIEDTVSKIERVIQHEFMNDHIRKRYKEIRNRLPSFAQHVDEIEVFLKNSTARRK